MLRRLQELLTPPVFADREQTRLARLLYRILIGVLVMVPMLSFGAWLPGMPADWRYTWLTNLALLLLTVATMALVRSGHLRAASMAFSISTWLLVTLSLVFFGGVSSPANVSYVIVALLAGTFWGGRALLGFCLATSLVVLAMAQLELRGAMPTPLTSLTPMNTWLTLSMGLVITAALLELTRRSAASALADARQHAHAALEASRKVETSRQLLATRVRQQAAVAELGQGAMIEGTPGDLMAVAAAAIARTLEVGLVGIYTREDHARLLLTASAGQPIEALDHDEAGSSIPRYTLEISKPVIVQDLAADERFPDAASLREAEVSSCLSVAIPGPREPHGAVCAYALESRRFSSDDVHFLQAVANLIALSVNRARSDQTLRAREEELRQAQKMEAIGRFAGGIAHDFNNLLTAIAGSNAFLLRGMSPGDPGFEDAREVQSAADMAASLTQQLLAFSRRQVLQPQLIDLNQVIRDTERIVGRLIGDAIDLRVALCDEGVTVLADPGQIQQVILNLATNARDAMPRGGRLSIETRSMEFDHDLPDDPAGVAAGTYVLLRVSDSGVGMDEATRERVFEPFFTTKDRHKGTGLGLSTVYGIVKQSKGSIAVESVPGGGTHVDIFLPRSEREVAQSSAPPVTAPLTRGSERILLAEDDPMVRRLVRRILDNAGYQILETRDGAEALALARSRDEPIDLLITDVIMPELGGGELADRMRACHPETRVLYMSGYANEAIGEHGVLAAEEAFLAKPFTPDALAQKVREVLDTRPQPALDPKERPASP